MKKIIAAFDGLKYSESTPHYAITLAKAANAHLVGVFLEDFSYHSYKYQDVAHAGSRAEQLMDDYDAQDRDTRKEAVKHFVETCQHAGVNFSVHHDTSIATDELLHESVYADLIIIDRKETLTNYNEAAPSRFLRDLLNDVQCPVLIVPEQYKPIDRIVLLYDGEPSSVFAIRMFSYILPSFKHLNVEVVSVRDVAESAHIPDNRLMKEFMKRHFPEATYTVLKGWAEEKIPQHLRHLNANALVVLGAYRRGAVSRWFRPSMADELLEKCNVPLFVAHSK
jgi:hypothetical protein